VTSKKGTSMGDPGPHQIHVGLYGSLDPISYTPDGTLTVQLFLQGLYIKKLKYTAMNA